MRKPKNVSKIALERIHTLFEEAERIFAIDKKLADRYVSLARKIGMKGNVRIPPLLQRRYCKHCYSYLYPGINLRVRMQKGHVVYYCLECKKFMRFVFR